jgi:hypothetical protein
MFSAMAHATPIHKTAQTGKMTATLSHTGQVNTLVRRQLSSVGRREYVAAFAGNWAGFFIRKRKNG